MATGVADYIGSLLRRDRRVDGVEPALAPQVRAWSWSAATCGILIIDVAEA